MSFKEIFGITKKVLVVEDDVVLRTALCDEFEKEGFKVLQAGDAKEVRTIMAESAPDAIVLDLILPLKDGISLLEELREAGHAVPVVILSNLLGSESLRADAERLDAVFYNKSSAMLTEIVQAVRERLT